MHDESIKPFRYNKKKKMFPMGYLPWVMYMCKIDCHVPVFWETRKKSRKEKKKNINLSSAESDKSVVKFKSLLHHENIPI